jgi:transcriptional regulator with XRE-family HTH domain
MREDLVLDFPARLRLARESVGATERILSARELDRLADLTAGHVSAIEAGRSNVEIRTACELARVLGVSLDWLILGNGKAPNGKSIASAVRLARTRG